VITGGRDTIENADLFKQVLTSSNCADPLTIPELTTGKIGMMVNPSVDDYWEGYYSALRMAKANGVQVLHSYLLWSQVEDTPGSRSWEWNDALMGYRFHEGFEVSLVINLIHTGVRGPIPEDLQEKAFDDPEFIQRFIDFILDVLERYPVQYLSIGNEVNDYFVKHRNEIPAYKTFFQEVYKAIKEEYPEIKVAMTFAYHDAESLNALDIVQQLDIGDFLPVTLYIYNEDFRFDRDPYELEAYFDRILELAGDKPIAFAEIGWNTAESLDGSQEDQAAFLSEAFRLLAEHQDQIEYLSWFNLHDGNPDETYEAALTFLTDRPDLARNEAFMIRFIDFLNYLGLREYDGTPKEAWLVFQQEASRYLQIIP
jgi:beta-glucosidase/6-phospho-beta-glucosidase/beta-galactosidase